MAIANVLLVAGSANFSTRDVWDGYRHALVAVGLNVIPYPTFSFLKVLSPDAVCNDIIGTALDIENRIDCVLFVDGLHFRGRRTRVPLSIRRAGIPTVLIATDDPYEPIPAAESLYTWRFTNEIRSAGNGVSYLPTATLPLPEVPTIESPEWDISFLGSVFKDRMPLLKAIAEWCEERQKRFLIAGKFLDGTEAFEKLVYTDIRSRTIETIEKWEIYSQSRVTLNLFRETDHPADSPSPRVFEVTAFGQTALLTGPRRAEVTRLYGGSVYHFDDASTAIRSLQAALANETDRRARVAAAREITLSAHLYEHRAADLLTALRDSSHECFPDDIAEERIAWIIGSGRTGSTWLAEMLGDLPKIRRWHEPYFGRFLKHLSDRPQELDRQSSFFARRHMSAWREGLRDMFFRMVRDRYPQFGRHSLVVKEVNTPELYGWLQTLFPAGKLILLVRDPFDVLDSYLDLQKPGSWNTQFGDQSDPLSEANVRRTAEHIRSTTSTALAAFEEFPLEQRLKLTYEDLLEDPVPHLRECSELVGIDTSSDAAATVADRHAFARYRQTGELRFRRQGKAGGWRESANFNRDVSRIAGDVLGPLRGRLSYRDA